ncbi:MAG: thiamine diphosphokinase [Chloroflexota bacterium]|nr:thiamine diphosphokinase [Chloroflexota bacterium]
MSNEIGTRSHAPNLRHSFMCAAIVTGGPVGDDAFVRGHCATADLLIAADAGALVLERLGIVPDLAVGDFDTAGPELVARLAVSGIPTETYPVAKDYTDTHLAIVIAIARGATEITVLGALGGPRYDHMLATALSLAAPTFAGVRILLMDPLHTMLVLRPGESVTLHGVPGEYVSLLALTEEVTGVSGDGLLYPLPAIFRLGDNIGVSNELTTADATVSVNGGGMLLVIHARQRAATNSE